MLSEDGSHRNGGVRVSLPRLALGAAGFVIVSIWAMGTPGNDPLGDIFKVIRDGAGNYADWAREGPMDGRPDWPQRLRPVAGGDAESGRHVVQMHGCGSCHVIPGIPRADGTVGPSLAGIADRAYLAGVLSNTAPNMVDYLVDPGAITPKTAMPDVGLAPADAADVAAFLYTLATLP